MTSIRTMACLACLAALAACERTDKGIPAVENGWVVYRDSRVSATVPCDDRPVLLAGDRLEMRLTGTCRTVRITGEHSDISVQVAPGGTIEITGAHNDVTWMLARPGARPNLIDTGHNNSFHVGQT